MKDVNLIPSPEKLGKKIGLSPEVVKIYWSDLEDLGVDLVVGEVDESQLTDLFRSICQSEEERSFFLYQMAMEKSMEESDYWSAVNKRLALQSQSQFWSSALELLKRGESKRSINNRFGLLPGEFEARIEAAKQILEL